MAGRADGASGLWHGRGPAGAGPDGCLGQGHAAMGQGGDGRAQGRAAEIAAALSARCLRAPIDVRGLRADELARPPPFRDLPGGAGREVRRCAGLGALPCLPRDARRKPSYAAAKRITEVENVSFNPLFLYGGVGLGKTHLMHAMALEIKKNWPERKVLYLSAEKFMYQFIKALRFKDTMSFKQQFRSVDVLMVDDIQFIAGKDSTQEEFFHTFNTLIDHNHQVVISADRSPVDLDGIEERIRSRLGWGLVTDIHASDYELRLGVLQTKAKKHIDDNPEIIIKDNILEFLAQRIDSNIRVLEGALNRVIAYSSFVKKPLTIEMAQEVLKDLIRASQRRITIDDIQRKVADYYNIRLSDLLSARRSRTIARPRQVAMYLSKLLTTRSLPEIGRKFGGRDHTTVIHAVKRIESLQDTDAAIQEEVDILSRSLEG